MANFGHLKKLSRITVKYELPDLGWGPCSLLVAPAGERNKDWLDETLRERAQAPDEKLEDSRDNRDKVRRRSVDRYARHVIRGWSNIVDEHGAQVECGFETARDFLVALCESAPDVFDRLQVFCLTMTNFTPALHLDVLTKN